MSDLRPVVVVTGASGLLGTPLCHALVPDYQVVALDVEEPSDLPPGAAYYHCDLTSEKSTRIALARVHETFRADLASVVHLAAYYDFTGAPSPLYEDLTVQGTRRLVDGLRRLFRTEQIVFSSSLLVMHPSEHGEIIDEGSPLSAHWDYPQSKIHAELMLRERRGPISTVILRLAGVYDEDGHSPPITQQIWRIRERTLESHFFPGDQSHGQPFVHLEDAVDCIRRVVDRRTRLGNDVFLVAEPEVCTYRELQELMGELIHGSAWRTFEIPAPLAKAGAWLRDKTTGEAFIKPWMIDIADAHYPVSIARARRLLDWEPQHRLRETIPVMIERLRQHPRRFYELNDLPDAEDQAESEDEDRARDDEPRLTPQA